MSTQSRLSFELSRKAEVILEVYDLAGRNLGTLLRGELAAGTYDVPFNADELASGVYFCKLTADGEVATGKMLLLK